MEVCIMLMIQQQCVWKFALILILLTALKIIGDKIQQENAFPTVWQIVGLSLALNGIKQEFVSIFVLLK